jgi:hypothetical protein
LSKRIYDAWEKSSPDGFPKLCGKPQKNTVNGTLDLTQLSEILGSETNFSVAFERQGEKRLE